MSTEIEQRLRDTLQAERLPSAPDALRAFLLRVPTELSAPTSQSGKRLAWLAPAMAAVLGGVLLVVLVPRATSPPAGPPSPSVSASTASGVVWTRVATMPDQVLMEGDVVMGAIAFNGSYVMVGNAQSADHAVWWHSDDGLTWRRRDTDPVFANSLLQQVVRTPNGLLIVGTANQLDAVCGGGVFGCDPVSDLRLWTSSDGQTWQLVPRARMAVFGRAVVQAVTLGPTGLVAAGGIVPATGTGAPVIWTSNDGTEWKRTTEFSSDFPSAVVAQLAATQSAYFAVGYRRTLDGSSNGGAAWYSTNGETWKEATGAERIGGSLVSVGAGALTFSLTDGLAAAQVLMTEDGSRWRATSAIPFAFGCGGPTLLSDGERIVAIGTRPTGPGIGMWVSSDAQHWQELTMTGEAAPPVRYGTGAVGSEGVVEIAPATGDCSNDTTSIWFGSIASGAGGLTESAATDLARDHVQEGAHLESAAIRHLPDGREPDRLVWAVDFTAEVEICPPTAGPCEKRPAETQVFLDYLTGEFLESSTAAPPPRPG